LINDDDIFKDRVEIRSPGLLYGGLTIDTIRKMMVSARRNELLAELFQCSHRIEKWGRSIKMILEREPATEFEEIGTVQFVATFKRKNYYANERFSGNYYPENVGENY
jgi:ATP-dependent DNA helicase RecG